MLVLNNSELLMNKFEFPEIEPFDITSDGDINRLFKLSEAHLAKYYYDKIKKVIKTFEERLSNNQFLHIEIILNDGSRITALSFGYYNPNMITVIGLNHNDEEVKLILPLSNNQIISTIKNVEPDKPQRKIGFHSE